jgi:hypothetical protein
MLREHPLDNSVAQNQVQEQIVQPSIEDTEMRTEPAKGPEITMSEEPEAGDADSLEIILRMPCSGERISRRFLKSDNL